MSKLKQNVPTCVSQTASQFSFGTRVVPGSDRVDGRKISTLHGENHCQDIPNLDAHFPKPLGLSQPLAQLRLPAVLRRRLAKLASVHTPELDFVG